MTGSTAQARDRSGGGSTYAGASGPRLSCAVRRRCGLTPRRSSRSAWRPAEPRNDGRQTPYRNHPVFVAQHATATCCRSCLETWHGIAKGHRLDRGERAYVVEVIGRWIDRELATSIEGRDSGSSTSRGS